MLDLCSQTPESLALWMEERGEKSFRTKQVFQWIYERSAENFACMTNLSQNLRVKLSENFQFPLLELVESQDSQDQQTKKFLWKLKDGKLVESVLISSGQRRTVCVSCQIGCPARCSFCASGKEGLMRNLSTAEIIEQVLHIDRNLNKIGERVTHIVFMGMGEPLENYEAVIGSIRLLIHPETFHISQRRITVSTVGIVEGIERLADEGLKVNLVLSLHAPNQHLRKKIIPYARRYPLENILAAMDNYFEKTKRDITYEYTLLSGINDGEKQAEELIQLLQKKNCTVNLIPYNPVSGLKLQRPKSEAIEQFRKYLVDAGINTTWRYTKGKDIAAACGQLALQKRS